MGLLHQIQGNLSKKRHGTKYLKRSVPEKLPIRFERYQLQLMKNQLLQLLKMTSNHKNMNSQNTVNAKIDQYMIPCGHQTSFDQSSYSTKMTVLSTPASNQDLAIT